MKNSTHQINLGDIYKSGEISRQTVYKLIRAGKLTFTAGKADVTALLAEWNAKRDPTRTDKLGEVLRGIIAERNLTVQHQKKPKPATREPAVVDSDGVPGHLSGEMRAFWKRVIAEYELEGDALLILKTACEAYDRAQEARTLIAKDGPVVNQRRHPAIDIESKSQSTFLRAMRQLGLDLVDTGPNRR